MSGLQDETSFSAGGGTTGEKRQVPEVPRPDPYAVKAAVAQQIIVAKEAAAEAKEAAETEFSSRECEIVDREYDAIDKADDTRREGEATAAMPVLEQQAVIADLEAQLRKAKMDLSARKVVFKAAK